MIKRILVAIDGSEQAKKALLFAIDLLAYHTPEIVLLSVVPPVSTPIKASYPGRVDEYSATLYDSHKEVLNNSLMKVKQDKPDINISTKLVEGNPAEQIVGTAKSGKFDMVVIGDHGYSGFKEFLLGSVSDRVADASPCPVLIVK